MLLADCTDAGELRGHALTKPAKLETLLERDPAPAAEALLGNGYLAFTVDQGDEQNRHQGIVSIQGERWRKWRCITSTPASNCCCQVRLACEQTSSGWRAGALILEKVAGVGGIDPDLSDAAQAESWHTATTLAATLTDQRVAGRRPAARPAAVSAIPY